MTWEDFVVVRLHEELVPRLGLGSGLWWLYSLGANQQLAWVLRLDFHIFGTEVCLARVWVAEGRLRLEVPVGVVGMVVGECYRFRPERLVDVDLVDPRSFEILSSKLREIGVLPRR